MYHHRRLLIIVTTVLLTMLVAVTGFSHGADNAKGGNGNGSGHVHNNPNNQVNDLLGCQRNNPDRLDCSSLEVTGYCDAGEAVFVIRNTGEAGNGDMRAPTAYRLVVDGEIVESGEVLLTGGATMEIRYDGGGIVTLYADQQVGHPGNSHPQTTLNCAAATPPPDEEPTEEPTPDPTDEVIPPVFDVDMTCEENGYVLITILNSGGDMLAAVDYDVTDGDGIVLASGWLQLDADESFSTSVTAAPILTLRIGDEYYTFNPECSVEPDPTEEPTPDEEPPVLDATGECVDGETARFVVTNYGGAMTEPASYVVYDNEGGAVTSGQIMLGSGESTEISVSGFGTFTFVIGDGQLVVSADCYLPDPTEEPTPDEEEPPVLDAAGECVDGETARFVVTNYGGAMTEPASYAVYNSEGGTATSGQIMLGSGESTVVEVAGFGEFTLVIGDGQLVVSADCYLPDPTEEPTPDPTEEPTPDPTEEPTPDPTEEPTPDPTEEPTPDPTEEPTPDPTEEPPLGCQRNNPDRLDCSSLQVTGYCDGNVAVFIITNTGEPGNGDMRAPTAYTVVVNGETVESGAVQLNGGTTMEVRYDGGGRVTLYADQQVGHPGNSHPQTTLNCGS